VSDESKTSDSATTRRSLNISVSDESKTTESVSVTVQSLIDRYRDVESDYQLLVNVVMALLREALKAEGIDFMLVEGRAKAADRVLDKARRPEKQYHDPLRDITDFAGVRVVVRRQADLESVVDCLRRHFQIDPLRSVDKRDELEEDRFGYRADHYIVRLKEAPDDRPRLVGLPEMFDRKLAACGE
jgi:GTP pyrophosphokinase